MNKKELAIIIYTITVLLSVMYATQPLQPLLSKEFSISMVQSSYFTAVIMFFLAIAPIIYGYVLESMNTKKVLMTASIILFFTNVLLSFSTTYNMFLLIRTIEAMVVPAILTACMTILANDKENIKVNMSIYVASTVFGGLLGRVMSGLIATEFGWRMVFLSLSFALLVGLYFIKQLRFTGDATLSKPKGEDLLNILKQKQFIVIYVLMFIVFFVFSGLLNLLPFMMKQQFPDISETSIGLLYLGYGMGIIVSLTIHKIVKFFDKELRTIIAGLCIFIGATLLFIMQEPLCIFGFVFIFCLGMFIIHTVSTRIVNSLQESQKALTSGMYLTFYYIGGAFGAIIPPMVYSAYSWNMTIMLFIGLLFLTLLMVFLNRKLFKAYT